MSNNQNTNQISLEELQRKIGYQFKDVSLLEHALTHPSLRQELPKGAHDYERLEFLGDAVLQLGVAEYLYKEYPDKPEGFLSIVRVGLVSCETLARFARDIQLDLAVHTSTSLPDDGFNDNLMEDAFEAILGAIYVDGGRPAAWKFISAYVTSHAKEMEDNLMMINPKGCIQEALQSVSPVSPVYKILNESGPSHKREFEAGIYWQNEELGRGVGKSKHEAEINAAKEAIKSDRFSQICEEE